MGATITTGKMASAFRRDDGTVIYALFEKTYEKNCYPHTPHWSCFAFGEYAEVMKCVFGHASACEGGCLQGNSGRWIKPENYIIAWQKVMAAPVSLTDATITLKVGEWGGSFSPDNLPAICATLSRFGRNDLANWLTLGEPISLQLHADIEIALVIYGVGKIESPYRVIDINCTKTLAHPELEPCKRTGKINPPVVSVLATDQYQAHDRQNRLVKIGDEPWLNFGWMYSAVQNFINGIAYQCEMICTGSAKALISSFREQCEKAESVSGDVEITFTRCKVGDDVHKWHVENLDNLAKMLGCGHAPIAPATFTRKFSDIRDNKDALYLLSNLKPQQYAWQIDLTGASAIGQVIQQYQFDLLAA